MRNTHANAEEYPIVPCPKGCGKTFTQVGHANVCGYGITMRVDDQRVIITRIQVHAKVSCSNNPELFKYPCPYQCGKQYSSLQKAQVRG